MSDDPGELPHRGSREAEGNAVSHVAARPSPEGTGRALIGSSEVSREARLPGRECPSPRPRGVVRPGRGAPAAGGGGAQGDRVHRDRPVGARWAPDRGLGDPRQRRQLRRVARHARAHDHAGLRPEHRARGRDHARHEDDGGLLRGRLEGRARERRVARRTRLLRRDDPAAGADDRTRWSRLPGAS